MITINILYKGSGDSAREFADEMISGGTVAFIRAEQGNCGYNYYIPLEDCESILLVDSWENQAAIDRHHSSPAMKKIAELREKYNLHMEVRRFVSDDGGIPESDRKFIRS